MKNLFRILLPGVMCLNLAALAQPGAPAGPRFGGAMDKLFGENQSYSALLEFQTTDSSGEATTMPGKIAFDAGKARFEMDMTEMKSSRMSPEAAAHMKQMGMDKMVSISRPDKKVVDLLYPGMQSYVENAMPESEAGSSPADYKVEITKLGDETVDGHPCVKNKITVTDKEGNKHESTVWNATDLKNFPVKIETVEHGNTVVMLFKNVSLAKPDASLFEPPADYTKYDSMQTMMQQQMMKRMGGGMFGH